MRRPDPATLEAAFLAFLIYVPMGYYGLRLLLVAVGL